jgi:hypothetical protein
MKSWIETALADLETNDEFDDLFDTVEKSDELPEKPALFV